jgi:hypothetical protein
LNHSHRKLANAAPVSFIFSLADPIRSLLPTSRLQKSHSKLTRVWYRSVRNPHDQYTLEAEILFENEHMPLPVRWIATNTDDKSTAETWMNIEQNWILLEFVFSDHAEGQLEMLQDHLHLELMANAHARCVLNSHELLRFGFAASELRPWKVEQATAA